ncbi:unannotated protein [freshwater metagenome]|uniref:Unannotated protein n=1 Tax=freshwater metagenome TaxID=449393 RepID=A0A6J7AEZ9_9ZZZZ
MEPARQSREVEVGGLKYFFIGPESNCGATFGDSLTFGKWCGGNTVVVGLTVSEAIAANFNIELFGKCIDDRDTNAVEPTRNRVARAAELAASVQDG